MPASCLGTGNDNSARTEMPATGNAHAKIAGSKKGEMHGPLTGYCKTPCKVRGGQSDEKMGSGCLSVFNLFVEAIEFALVFRKALTREQDRDLAQARNMTTDHQQHDHYRDR